MPRPIWSGAISFGLINVPVKVMTATSAKDVRFHQLEASTNARIKQKKVSSLTGEEVTGDQIVKGYEIAPDQYVVITGAELDALDPVASRTIDIEDFVSIDEVDPLYFEKGYYLVPDAVGAKAYALLRQAMAAAGRVAIARFVLRTKQYLALIRPYGNALVLETLLFGDEVASPDELSGLPEDDVEVKERELAMAEQLIDTLTVEFDPSKYRDTYREKVLELIDAKAQGRELAAVPDVAEPAPVVDLVAALEASLKAAKRAS